MIFFGGCFRKDAKPIEPSIPETPAPPQPKIIDINTGSGANTETGTGSNVAPKTNDALDLQATGEIKFDSCGKITKYTSEDWFTSLKQQSPNLEQGTSEACYSSKGKVFIFLMPAYCGEGKIFRYNIDKNMLSEAIINKKGKTSCVASAQGFGKRNNNTIPLNGQDGDAGSGQKVYYIYDFVKNVANLEKIYTFSDNPTKGTWEYFNK